MPAPEANDNPFGYKFSWSPRGVLLAGLNSARFRRDGRWCEVPGEELMDCHWKVPVEVEGKVVELRRLPEPGQPCPMSSTTASTLGTTMFRGTLRNPWWCAAMKQMARLGLLRTDRSTGWRV